MNSPLKIVFLGTPEFACPTLQALLNNDRFKVEAVITQEDKRVGRKQELTPSPVKTLALQHGLPVFQPVKLSKDLGLIEQLKQFKPDFLVVVAYGQIVSQKVLDIPAYKPINIHGSILPKYRGASPIEQTLLNGDAEAGISIMEMTLKMDQGPVYEIHKILLTEADNNPLVREKLSRLGAEKLPDCLIRIAQGEIVPQPQDESLASYCQKINKEDGLIDPFQDPADKVINKLRAFTPWPGIFLTVQGKKLKINKARSTEMTSIQPGRFEISQKQLFLNCLDRKIEILELQLEGKNNQPASTFLLGNASLLS